GGTTPAGAISVDAAYSPITRVAYNVEMSRLGKITDYEKLVLEGWTNGAVSPDDALTRASTFLRDHFSPLALPAGAINALKGAELNLVADLVQKTEADLADVKNLGEKSIDEIKTAL